MRFKKFLSCLLVSSLVNSGFVWSMPGKDPGLVALEERTQAGWQKFKHLQQKIIEVTGAQEKTGPSNPNLKEPMAEMSGPFMGNYLISQEMARMILSIDEVGDVKKEFDTGTSPVAKVENVFFKTDGRHFNPDKPMLSPALENSAYWFYHIMFGAGATPSSLITINKVLIKRPPFSLLKDFEETFKFYQMCRDNRRGFPYFFEESLKRGKSKEVLDKFREAFEPTYESFIAQASLGFGSEGLDEFIKSMENKPQRFEELKHKNISIHFMTTLLLNLSDAKGDNFRVENGEIVGIDNDRFFAPDIFRQCFHQEEDHAPYILCDSSFHRVGVRSIFYGWKDILLLNLDSNVRNILTRINPWNVIGQWLYKLYLYDEEFNKLKQRGVLAKEWFETLPVGQIDNGTKGYIRAGLISHSPLFPLHFFSYSISEMINKLDKINDLIDKENYLDHKKIVESIHYHVYKVYESALIRESNASFHDVVGGIIIEKCGYSYEDLNLSNLLTPELIKVINKPRKAITIKDAFVELKNQIKLKNVSILSLVENGLSAEVFRRIVDPQDIEIVDKNNHGLVHKAVLSAKLDLDNAEKLLEALKELRANLDLKATVKTKEAGTPLTQAMILEEDFAIPIFNKLIELGAGVNTHYFAAEKFINKNESRLIQDPKFKQMVQVLLRRDPKLHWYLSLNKLLPIVKGPKVNGVIIKTTGSQERFLSNSLEITMLDKKGNLANQAAYGRRDVASIKSPDGLYGLYFKSFPELPGVEEQVGRLTRNLLGFGAPYTELVRYKDIPILLSQAIIGENLQEVLNKNPDILKRLDPKSISGMILLSILINPEDGKPDNFIVEPIPGNEGKYRLVCIDNDHAFVPAVAKEQRINWSRTHNVIQVRSVLYCLDQMNSSIDKEVKDLFIKLNPADVVTKWLNELNNISEMYTILFNANEMKDYFKKKECFLGVPFKENLVPELYQKLLRLKDALEENENITHLDLLMKLEPLLGKRYVQVLSKPVSVKERFDEVDGVFYSKAMNSIYGTVTNSKALLTSMQIPDKITVIEELRRGKLYGISQAITQLKEMESQQTTKALYTQAIQNGIIVNFKNLIAPKILEEVLEKIDLSEMSVNNEQILIRFLKENKLEQVRNLYLLGSKVIIDDDLKNSILGIGNLTSLDIRGCTNLTQNIFYQISQECQCIRRLLAAGIGNKNNPVKEISNNKLFVKEHINFAYLERLNINDLPELTSIKITAPKLKVLEANNCPKLNLANCNQLNLYMLERIELKYNNWINNDDNIFKIIMLSPCIKICILEECPNINNYTQYSNIKELYTRTFRELEINENDKKVVLPSKALNIIQIIAISSLINLTFLDLSDNQIEADAAKSISCLHNLTYLNLWNNQIEARGAKYMSSLTNLTSLNLKWNKIGAEGAKSLSSLYNLTSLDLSSNEIGTLGAKSIAFLTNLTFLDLYNNGIGAEGAKFITSLTNLTFLDLYKNQIGEEGAKSIASLINLASLSVMLNQIGDEGAKSITSLTNLTFINLSSNRISDEGAKYISLLSNLVTLNLYNNQIGDEGAKYIAALCSLATLNLWDNQIGAVGANSLSSLFNLTAINLEHNKIGNEGAKALFSLTHLTSLNIGYNQVGVKIMRKLEDMVKQNKTQQPTLYKDRNHYFLATSKDRRISSQSNWTTLYKNAKVNFKTSKHIIYDSKEENFNKINLNKMKLVALSINIIKQNIDITTIAGRQLQTLIFYYNQAQAELKNIINKIDFTRKANVFPLYQAELLLTQREVDVIIGSSLKDKLNTKIKQMKDVMDLLDHYLQNNPNVCKSIVLHTLKHFNQAIYQEDGSLDTNFLDLYSKTSGKSVFIWQEKATGNKEKGLELVYANANSDKDPRNGQNFLYNPQDSSLLPLGITKGE